MKRTRTPNRPGARAVRSRPSSCRASTNRPRTANSSANFETPPPSPSRLSSSRTPNRSPHNTPPTVSPTTGGSITTSRDWQRSIEAMPRELWPRLYGSIRPRTAPSAMREHENARQQASQQRVRALQARLAQQQGRPATARQLFGNRNRRPLSPGNNVFG